MLRFLDPCMLDRIDILMNRVIGKMVDLALSQSLPKTDPAISCLSCKTTWPQPSFPIQIDFLPTMSIAEPGRRNPGDDIVVIDVPEMVEFGVLDVAEISNPRTSKGEQSLWVAVDV